MPGNLQTFTADPTLVGNAVQWKLCHTNPEPDACGDNAADYPDVTLGANKGAYPFQFEIVGDETGLGLIFASTNPIQIKSGEPTGPGQQQIGPPGGGGTAKLTFVDANSLPNPQFPDPVVLNYQLNFTDKDGNAVTPIDPVIINGGTNTYTPPSGGWGFLDPSSSAFYVLMAMVIFASLVGNLLARLIKAGRG